MSVLVGTLNGKLHQAPGSVLHRRLFLKMCNSLGLPHSDSGVQVLLHDSGRSGDVGWALH